jgi:hypothetical protein
MAGQMTMPVPAGSALMSSTPSPADQVAGETAEARRKRLQAIQAARGMPAGLSSLAQGYGAALATTS